MQIKARILLVDEEERFLKIMAPLLEDNGYFVRTASNPKEAVAALETDAFEIAFIDQFMGDDRGTDLMKKLLHIKPELSCVIMTGSGSTDLALESMKLGAFDFLSKPFFLQDLVRSIDYVQKKRELESQKREMLILLETRVEEKTEKLKKVYFDVLTSLAKTMEKKDTGTYGHSMRVSRTSSLIAAALELDQRDRETLQAAAMLHDIGKIGTSDFILGKQGPLSADEMNSVRSHPQKGVEILGPLEPTFRQMAHILPAILHHHESYDGSGYPGGLSGENIPLFSRIISIADTYDAITSNRPYRRSASHDMAVKEIIMHSGRQFDKEIVDAFVSLHEHNSRLSAVQELGFLF